MRAQVMPYSTRAVMSACCRTVVTLPCGNPIQISKTKKLYMRFEETT